MNKYKRDHLNSITEKSLTDWRKDTFVCFASAIGNNGFVQLGINGNGNYVVIHNGKKHECLTTEIAVDKYKRLFRETPEEDSGG